MKIIYLVPSLENAGGIEKILVQKANYLVRFFGFDITIVTFRQREKKIFFSLDNRIKVFHLKAVYPDDYQNRSLLKKLVPFFKVRFYLKKEIENILFSDKYDFCISFLMDEITFLPKIKDGSIKVGECHGMLNEIKYWCDHSERLKNKFVWYLRFLKYNYFANKFDKLIFLTEIERKMLLFNNRKDLLVIPNFIKYDEYENINNCESKKVINVGSLVPLKGHERLIQAWAEVIAEFPDWQLNIYGDGPEKEKLFDLIFKLNLIDNVKIYEPIKNLEEVYSQYAFTVIASKYEGFTMVALESLSKGIPVVAFRVYSGLIALFQNDFGGILVKDNDVHGYANQLKEMIGNEFLRKQKSIQAKELIKEYSENVVMNKWLCFFYKNKRRLLK